jgi:hypothetical protein
MSKKEVNLLVFVRVKKLRVYGRVPCVVMTLDAIRIKVIRVLRYEKSMGLIEMKAR